MSTERQEKISADEQTATAVDIRPHRVAVALRVIYARDLFAPTAVVNAAAETLSPAVDEARRE